MTIKEMRVLDAVKTYKELEEARERITQLEQENDAMRADLLLWEEKEVRP